MTGSPSECYWYMRGPSRYFIGITLHLSLVLPAAMLAVLQFVPALRQKYPAYHRRAGYVSLVMALLGALSTIPIADRSFGGTMSTRGAVGALFIASTTAFWKAWRGIRSGRIDQHRAWMLRAWGWMGAIVTMRPILVLAALLISQPAISPPTYMPMLCDQLHYVFEFQNPNASMSVDEALYAAYPLCAPENAALNPSGNVLVKADLAAAATANRHEMMAASMNAVFGMAIWVGFAINAAAVEWYLSSTRDEAERLRTISARRIAKMASKVE